MKMNIKRWKKVTYMQVWVTFFVSGFLVSDP